MDLTDKILITLQSSKNPFSARNIRSNHPMFDKELRFRYGRISSHISLEVVDLDYVGKTVKPYHVNGSSDKRFQVPDTSIQPGLYQIQEYSEDYLVINLLEPIKTE